MTVAFIVLYVQYFLACRLALERRIAMKNGS